MAILTPTKDKGATTKRTFMVVAEPDRLVTDEQLAAMMPDGGMNGPFVADLLSAMLTHERCGRHLYRSVEGRTNNPMLQAKYREFGDETEQHVDILERLIAEAGGNPAYVSPMARAVQGTDTRIVESTFVLAGSLDVMTAEMAMLDGVFLAESMDNANWTTFNRLVEMMPDGDLRQRFEAAGQEVGAQEQEHIGWATQTKERLTLLQATSKMTTSMGAKADELMARVKNWLAD
jgi:rubrerythrin